MQVASGLPPDAPVPTSLNFKQFLNFFAVYKQDAFSHVPDADIFRVLDEDANGSVSSSELVNVLNGFGMKVSLDECHAMADFATLRNGDMQIGRADFRDVAKRVEHFRLNPNVEQTDSS